MSKEKTKEERIKKVQSEIASMVKPEGQVTSFKFADLVLHCGNCGHDEVLESNVQTGRQLRFLRAEDGQNGIIALACSECQNYILLHFVDAANPPTEEEIAKMEKKIADQREALQKAAKENAKSEHEVEIEEVKDEEAVEKTEE